MDNVCGIRHRTLDRTTTLCVGQNDKEAQNIQDLNVTIEIYATIGGPSSNLDEFLALRSQFDRDHGVDFSTPTVYGATVMGKVPALIQPVDTRVPY